MLVFFVLLAVWKMRPVSPALLLDDLRPCLEVGWSHLVINHNWSTSVLIRQSIMQHHIEQCLVNMNSTVVTDVAELAEVVHELADARAGGANHIGELLLGDWRYHALRLARLSELCHDEQCAREALLAIVEQLIDKVLTSPDSTDQDELQEDV